MTSSEQDSPPRFGPVTSRATRHGAGRPSFLQARHKVSEPVDCYVTGLKEAVDEVSAARILKHGALCCFEVFGSIDRLIKLAEVEIYRSVSYDAGTYREAV